MAAAGDRWSRIERRFAALAADDASRLGRLLAAHIAESVEHDAINHRDRAPVARFLEDLALYVENAD